MKKPQLSPTGAGDAHLFADALSNRIGRRTFLKGALATAPIMLAAPTLLLPRKAAGSRRFSPVTSAEPYLVPTVPGVEFVPLLTVGESVGGYRMVGIPDGLGAFRGREGQFTLLMNHEITAARPGIVRQHGSNGAFVSRWTIDRQTLRVVKGQDLTPSAHHVFLWDSVHNEYIRGTTQWQRLCSGDLPELSALYAHGLGTAERIFFNGEEINEGRAWARIVTGPHAGEAWQLPRLGRMSYENVVACPYPQEKTIAFLMDDADLSTAPSITGFPSEVYVYIGKKQKSGHPIERAGLTNGHLYGLKISVNGSEVTEESDLFGLGTASSGFIAEGRFSLYNLGDVSNLTPRQFQDASIAAGITRFRRPEDGAWDPRPSKRHRADFYFVTTADINTNSRLWRVRFDDIEKPEAGGTIEILLFGDEGHRMLDNVCIDGLGRILMQEDPGNQPRNSKIWLYQIASGELIQIAQHNPKFFDPSIPNNSSFLTQDEESSGIIDASEVLGEGWFLLDVQAHKNNPDAELVEFGQLLAMYVDPKIGNRRPGRTG